MNCDDWQLLVEEFFDGELDTDTALKVRNHLDHCSSCTAALKSLSVERSVYAGYNSDIEVRPEMWAAVSQRITAASASSSAPAMKRFGSWLRNVVTLPPVSAPVTAALVLVAVVLTVLVMRYMSSPQVSTVAEVSPQAAGTSPGSPATHDEGVPTSGESSLPAGPTIKGSMTTHDDSTTARHGKLPPANRQNIAKTKDPSRLVREAEQKYLAAIAMLSRNIDRKRTQLDPATIAELDQALSSIDRTIAATRNAVRRHPDDPLAAQYMLTAYAKKVDVLRGLADY